MTKSSKRPAKVGIYDELHDLHDKVLVLVGTLDGAVTAYKEAEHINIPNREQIGSMVSTIIADADKYRNDVEKLYNEHKDKRGDPKRSNQYMVCHSIGNDYMQIIDSITAATLPIVSDVLVTIEKVVHA
jgi:hypothetical protein